MKASYCLPILITIVSSFSNNVTGQNPHNWNYTAKNLSLNEIYLSLDDKPYLKDEFPLGSTARFVFDGIKGYRLKGDKAFPRLAMQVREKKSNGKVILQYDNLLKEYESTGVDPKQASTLSARLSMGAPLAVGEKYTWEITISESTGKGKIDLRYDFEIVEGVEPRSNTDENNFIFDANNLEAEGVQLELDGQPYASTDLPYQKTIDMVFLGVKGFEEENGMVYPGLAIKVTDNYGNLVLLESDLFAQYNRKGLSPEQATRLASTLTIGDPMRLGESYTWEVRIWDKIWPKRTLDAVLHFVVIQ